MSLTPPTFTTDLSGETAITWSGPNATGSVYLYLETTNWDNFIDETGAD